MSKALSNTLLLALKAFSHSLTWLIYVLYEMCLFLLRERNRETFQLQVTWIEFRKEKGLCLCTSSPAVEVLKQEKMHLRRCSWVSSEGIVTRAFILQVAAVPGTEEPKPCLPWWCRSPAVEANSLFPDTNLTKRDTCLNSNPNNFQT